jgi:hypothetical protein
MLNVAMLSVVAPFYLLFSKLDHFRGIEIMFILTKWSSLLKILSKFTLRKFNRGYRSVS